MLTSFVASRLCSTFICPRDTWQLCFSRTNANSKLNKSQSLVDFVEILDSNLLANVVGLLARGCHNHKVLNFKLKQITVKWWHFLSAFLTFLQYQSSWFLFFIFVWNARPHKLSRQLNSNISEKKNDVSTFHVLKSKLLVSENKEQRP